MKKKEIDDKFALDWLVCEDRPFLFYGAKEKDKEYKETLSLLFFNSLETQTSLDT